MEEDLKKNQRFLKKSSSVMKSYDKIRKNIETQWDECNKSKCITQLKHPPNPTPYFQSYNSSYCGDLIKKIKDRLRKDNNYLKKTGLGVNKTTANLKLTAVVDPETPVYVKTEKSIITNLKKFDMDTSWGAQKRYSPYNSQFRYKDMSMCDNS
jgi:hypothetical protein